MGSFESGMLSGVGCGCCCLAVAFVLVVAGVMAWQRRRDAPAAVPGTVAAPERGSSTSARLTFMGQPAPASPSEPPPLEDAEGETVQLRPALRKPTVPPK
jgi:uncharacterized iron-regulated membrane protein